MGSGGERGGGYPVASCQGSCCRKPRPGTGGDERKGMDAKRGKKMGEIEDKKRKGGDAH